MPANSADSEASRQSLTTAILEILDDWGVPAADQAHILGLAEDTKPRTLLRHRNGTPLPEGEEIDQRCKELLAIASACRTAFPHTSNIANLWITTENRYFSGKTPLTIMLEYGIDGMQRIRSHLDGTGSW